MNGLLTYPFMQHAFEAGAAAAVVAGVVGYFVILRRTAFAAHALSHVGFTGAAGALVVGISPLAGLAGTTVLAGVVMGLLGERARERDTVIGLVLAWILGLGVLFLSFYTGYATAAYALLFGDLLAVTAGDVLFTTAIAVVAVAGILAIYRPLLYASVDADAARARGVPVRLISVVFMVILAGAVAAAVQVIGVLLVFSLMVTPAAIAERVTARPVVGIAVSVLGALAFTWGGLLTAWYVDWPPSVFVTSYAFGTYLVVRAVPAVRSRVRAAP